MVEIGVKDFSRLYLRNREKWLFNCEYIILNFLSFTLIILMSTLS